LYLTKTAVIEIIESLLPTFQWVFPGLAVTYKYMRNYSGVAMLPRHIILSRERPTLEAFFHELMHIYCYDNNIFPLFHKEAPRLDNLDLYFSQALDAEEFVENSAAVLCNFIFPEYQWEFEAYATYKEQEDLYKQLQKEAMRNSSCKP